MPLPNVAPGIAFDRPRRLWQWRARHRSIESDPKTPFSKLLKEPSLAKPEWGTKRICPSCGTRYYDLLRDPIVCPKCHTPFDPEAFLRARRARPAAPVEKELEPVGAEEVDVDLEGEDIEAAEEEEPEEEETVAVQGAEEEEEEEELIEDASELGEDEDDMAEVIDNVEEEEP
jgi:uncharacterized protein (TIGR02300 family)